MVTISKHDIAPKEWQVLPGEVASVSYDSRGHLWVTIHGNGSEKTVIVFSPDATREIVRFCKTTIRSAEDDDAGGWRGDE